MPASDGDAGLGDLVRPTAQDLADDVGVEVLGEGAQVQREERLGAHGVDVAERVGGRDGPKPVGVVDDRRKEVDGLHDGLGVIEAVDGGVIGRAKADQQVGEIGWFEARLERPQHGGQGLGPQLGRSPGAGRHRGQADLFAC